MSHGSLAQLLYGPTLPRGSAGQRANDRPTAITLAPAAAAAVSAVPFVQPLSLTRRLQLATDLARGVAFLHGLQARRNRRVTDMCRKCNGYA